MTQNKTKAQQYVEKHITDKYKLIQKVGSGAYGHVWKVQCKKTKKFYALKKIFSAFQNDVDSQRTFRQICFLKKFQHPNIVKLHKVIKADNNMDLYLLFDFLDSDLFNAIRDNVLNDIHKKYIIYQLVKCLIYLRSLGIVHRDIKPSNVLINQNCITKLCDFGLSRSLQSYNGDPAVLTQFIATRWYRAPQVLLGSQKYNQTADLWSLGCLIYQLYQCRPLLPGDDSLDQIEKVIKLKGYPSAQEKKAMKVENIDFILSHFEHIKKSPNNPINEIKQPQVKQLIYSLLNYNPELRWTPQQILNCRLLKQFVGFQQLIQAPNKIKLYPSDNEKLSANVYKSLIAKLFLKQDSSHCSSSSQLKNSTSLYLTHNLKKKSNHKKQNSLSLAHNNSHNNTSINSPYIFNSRRLNRKSPQPIQLMNLKKIKKNIKTSEQKVQKYSHPNSLQRRTIKIKDKNKENQLLHDRSQEKPRFSASNIPTRRLKRRNKHNYIQ